jgi:DNA mismatch repair protein MutL
LGKLIRGIKTRRRFYFWNTDFLESEEVTGSLFNEEEVEQTVNNAYQIQIHCFSYQIRNGYCGSAAHQRVLYEQF